MTETPNHDQTTQKEALSPAEVAEMHDPRVGDGTPETAPSEPVPETVVDKVRAKVRRDP